jgi:hypothetical protein
VIRRLSLRRLIAAALPTVILTSGLVALAPAAEAANVMRVINADGGGEGTGLRFYFANAQIQITRDGGNQVFGPDYVPDWPGSSVLYNGIFMRVGNTIVGPTLGNWVYEQPVVNGMRRFVDWTSITTAGGSQSGPGTITARLAYQMPYGSLYTLDYTATLSDINDDFITETLTVNVPAGNTEEIKVYRAIDTYLGGSDQGPGYAKFPGGDTTKVPTEVGVVNRNGSVVEAYRDTTPTWDGWFSAHYLCSARGTDSWCGAGFRTQPILAGGNLWRGLQAINGNAFTDNGIAVMWDTPEAAGSTTYDYEIIFTKGPGVLPPEIRPAEQRVAGRVNDAFPSTHAFRDVRFTGSVSYSIAPALPAGLSLDPTTGVISGTPSERIPETTYTVTAKGPAPQAASARVILSVDRAASDLVPREQEIAGQVGQPLDPTMPYTAYGFDGDVTYSVTPDLPRGLSLDSDTGVVSGTPRQTTVEEPYIVTATDGDTTHRARIQITIDPKDPRSLVLTPAEQEIGGQVRRAIDATTPFTAYGFDGDVEYSIQPELPSGLQMDPVTGVISGTPREQVDIERFVVTATHKEESAQAEVIITIDPKDPDPLSLAPVDQVVPGIVGKPIDPTTPFEAFGFSRKPTYTLYPDTPPGLQIDEDTGVITGTPTEEFWARYLIIADFGDERATAEVSFQIDSRGGSLAPAEQTLSGVVGRSLASSTAYVAYGFDRNPTYTIKPALPTGLTLDRTTGVISGRPTATMDYTRFIVSATDGDITRQAVINVTINPQSDGTCISPEQQRGAGVVGRDLTRTAEYSVYGVGRSVRFTITPSLPRGLAIDPFTGIVSGTPQQTAAIREYTVTASGSKGSVQATIVLSVQPGGSLAPAEQNLSGLVGQEFTASTPYAASGFDSAPTYTIKPALPRGLAINRVTGIISGTPRQVLDYGRFTVRATDGAITHEASVVISIGKRTAGDTISPRTQKVAGLAGRPINATAEVAVAGVGAGVRYTVTPALPAGLTIDPDTGIISGRPMSGRIDGTFTIIATGASGSVTATVELLVDGPSSTSAMLAPRSQQVSTATGSAMEETVPFMSVGLGVTPRFTVSPALPEGLTIDPRTGIISGTPTESMSTSEFTVTARGRGREATATVTIVVGSPSTREAQKPTEPLGLPRELARGEWTKVIDLPVMTNADQEATVVVECAVTGILPRAAVPAGDIRGCRIERRNGAIWAWTVITPVRVSLTAEAVPGFTAYNRDVVLASTR